MKTEFINLVTDLVDWIQLKIEMLKAEVPCDQKRLLHEMNVFKSFRMLEKPKKYEERISVEEHFFNIQTKMSSNHYKLYQPPEGFTLHHLATLWQELEKAEHLRGIGLREELARQEKLASLAEKYDRKAKLRETWLEEMNRVMDMEVGLDLNKAETLEAALKRHHSIETDIKGRQIRFELLTKFIEDLQAGSYHKMPSLQKRQDSITSAYEKLLHRLSTRTQYLASMKAVSSVSQQIDCYERELETIRLSLIVNYESEGLDLVSEKLDIDLSILNSKAESVNKFKRGLQPNTLTPYIQEKISKLEQLVEDIHAEAKMSQQGLNSAKKIKDFLEEVNKEQLTINDRIHDCLSREVIMDQMSLARGKRKQKVRIL